ncbi:MAG: DUF4266 domain-containing protein [Gammaproteobacteria bacterium]|nr:DUF4266 domain-containing protein [Gammaproteobacteria bacterium]
MKTRLLLPVTLGLLALTLTGCSLGEVKPWDRDLLAQEKMQLVVDPLESYLDEHIYFSKEASFGGQGIGGGGCGCN